MADAKKCDRCGKFYVDKEKKFRINSNGNKGIPSWIKIINIEDTCITHFELCEQCMKDLWRWLCNEQESECELDEAL